MSVSKVVLTSMLAFALSGPALAQQDSHNMGEGMGDGHMMNGGHGDMMREHMEKMQQHMQQMSETDDPEERSQMMQEHMRQMQQHMQMMQQMMGNMHGGGEGMGNMQGEGHGH